MKNLNSCFDSYTVIQEKNVTAWDPQTLTSTLKLKNEEREIRLTWKIFT